MERKTCKLQTPLARLKLNQPFSVGIVLKNRFFSRFFGILHAQKFRVLTKPAPLQAFHLSSSTETRLLLRITQ